MYNLVKDRYRLLALDMDGTVLNHEQQISEANRKWIQVAVDNGITVIFATGRGIQNVIGYVEDLGLHSPIVTANGSEVWKRPNELLSRHMIENDWIEKLRLLALEEDVWYWGYSVEGLYNKENWNRECARFQWLKFGFYTEELHKLTAIKQTIQEWDVFEITNSHPNNIEINPKGINKASGLKQVCQMMGISMSQVAVAGDSLNDLAMIKQAGLGVAMGNAQDVVKQAADVITLNNDEDGVAHFIQFHLLAKP